MVVEGAAETAIPEIVLISNGFQSEYEIGFANGLARNGLRTLLVCSDNLPPARLERGVRLLNLRGSQDAKRHRLVKTANILRYWFATIRVVRRQSPTVVHLIGVFTLRWSVAGFIEAVVWRACSRRFLLTVHNVLPHDAHGRFNRLVYRWIYRLPHVLVVHTERMRNELVSRMGVPLSRILVMEHGIDRVAPPSPDHRAWLRRRYDLGHARPVVLFFGNVARYKGLDLLARAFELLPLESRAMLVIAGRCRETELRLELEARLAPLRAARRAIWSEGFVPADDVWHYFLGADLLAMPYRHIDQSGVVFMALATGLPVIAADVGSLREYVPLTGGCLVPPEDPMALAGAIQDMAQRAPEIDRDRVIHRAQRFLWVQTVRPLLAVYGQRI